MKRTRYTSIIFCFLIAALLLPDSAGGRQLGKDRLGHEWSMSEAGYTGRWVRRGNSDTWDATWSAGQVAILSMTLTGSTVRISRRDVGAVSVGATAIYEGTLAADGTIQGTVTTNWPGHFTNNVHAWNGRIVTEVQSPPVSSLTGPWVHSADPNFHRDDDKVIIVQDGNQATLTQTTKVNGRWVTAVCRGSISGRDFQGPYNYAPGGNPFGYSNITLTLKISADGNHLDGAISSLKTGGSQESHYSRVPGGSTK